MNMFHCFFLFKICLFIYLRQGETRERPQSSWREGGRKREGEWFSGSLPSGRAAGFGAPSHIPETHMFGLISHFQVRSMRQQGPQADII